MLIAYFGSCDGKNVTHSSKNCLWCRRKPVCSKHFNNRKYYFKFSHSREFWYCCLLQCIVRQKVAQSTASSRKLPVLIKHGRLFLLFRGIQWFFYSISTSGPSWPFDLWGISRGSWPWDFRGTFFFNRNKEGKKRDLDFSLSYEGFWAIRDSSKEG